MPVVDRNESIRRFKTDVNCRLLLATPGAAKEGLTLTIANHAIFYDRGFSLDDYLQAQDRIHRISQTEECFVHNFIAKGTIDEWVDILLNAKYQAAQLTQGDISREEFDSGFTCDLSGSLAQILSPKGDAHVGYEEYKRTYMKEIKLLGKTIPVSNDYKDIDTLKFLKDNPRVYSCTHGLPDFENWTEEEQQEAIFQRLLQEPSVKNLLPDVIASRRSHGAHSGPA